MTALPWTGVAAFVWQDPPGAVVPGVGCWLVKAANGNGHTNPSGFDFRTNYQAWEAAHPGKVIPWTWLYGTTDGATAARMLLAAAPHAGVFLLDVEGDDAHWANLPTVVTDCVAELRAQRKGCQVGFTCYPDRAQAEAHHAPWQALISCCDFGVPQVYYDSQGRKWDQIVTDHKNLPVLAAFSPGDWPDWTGLAQRALRDQHGIALWRYPDTRRWAETIARLAEQTPTPPSTPSGSGDDMNLKQVLFNNVAWRKGTVALDDLLSVVGAGCTAMQRVPGLLTDIKVSLDNLSAAIKEKQ